MKTVVSLLLPLLVFVPATSSTPSTERRTSTDELAGLNRKVTDSRLLAGEIAAVSHAQRFFADEGKAAAKALATRKYWFVSATTKDPAPLVTNRDGSQRSGNNIGSMDCGDCIADIVIAVSSAKDGKWDQNLCIHKSNPQFAQFAKLKRGSQVSFRYVEAPTQKQCGSGAFVKIVQR